MSRGQVLARLKGLFSTRKERGLNMRMKIAVVFFFLACPVVSVAQDEPVRFYGSTTTIFRFLEVLDPNDPSSKVYQIPAYEYITLGSDNVGVQGLSVFLRGFGKLEVIDPVEGAKFDGDVLFYNLGYRTKNGRFRAKVGRQFIYGGAGNNVLLDGVMVQGRPWTDIDLSAYGGFVTWPSLEFRSSNYAFGARAAYDRWDYGRIGVSLGLERDGGDIARANIGLDFAYRQFRWLDLSGYVLFDTLDRLMPVQETKVAVAYIADRYFRFALDYGLFNPVGRLPKTSIFTVFTNSRYHAVGGEASVRGDGPLSVSCFGRYFRYDENGENGYQIGIKPVLSFGYRQKYMVGLDVQRVRGYENAYTLVRGFSSLRPWKKLELTLDYADYLYDEKVQGYDRSHVAGFTLGYQVVKGGRIQGDVVVTVNPEFRQQVAGLVKFVYEFSTLSR